MVSKRKIDVGRNRRIEARHLRPYITTTIADMVSRLLVEDTVEPLDTPSEIEVALTSPSAILSLTQDASTGATQLITCARGRAVRRT